MKRLTLAVLIVAASLRALAADGGYQELTFATLGDFKFAVPPVEINDFGEVRKPPKLKDKIPPAILALKGKRVSVRGYMLPLEGGKDGLKQFILMRNQITCCFGDSNQVTGYINVTMASGRKAKPVADTLVTAYGTLDVGPVFEDGMLREIYRMKADEVQ